jgi:F0F1-type ATP synthase membrane subunit b/b'
MNYQKDVEQEAIDFLLENEEIIKKAIKEGKDFDREAREKLPSMQGKYKGEIQKEIERLKKLHER